MAKQTARRRGTPKPGRTTTVVEAPKQAAATTKAERDRGRATRIEAALGSGRIKVRATKPGYYGLKRRREGDVFVLRDRKDFSRRWMALVDGATPVKTTTGKQHLKKQHDDILGQRFAERAAGETDPAEAPAKAGDDVLDEPDPRGDEDEDEIGSTEGDRE